MFADAALLLKYAAVDLLGSFLYFPIWWYTKGALRVGVYCLRTIRRAGQSLGVGIWLKNLFNPMYGQRDVWSRVISFFMRLAAILFYSFLLTLLSALMTALFAAWLLLPAVAAYDFWLQLAAVFKILPA